MELSQMIQIGMSESYNNKKSSLTLIYEPSDYIVFIKYPNNASEIKEIIEIYEWINRIVLIHRNDKGVEIFTTFSDVLNYSKSQDYKTYNLEL